VGATGKREVAFGVLDAVKNKLQKPGRRPKNLSSVQAE
jgi:hypothetical protein